MSEGERENLISITCPSVYLSLAAYCNLFYFYVLLCAWALCALTIHAKKSCCYPFDVIFRSLVFSCSPFFRNKIKISLLQSLSDVFLSTCFAFKLWKNCICFSFLRFYFFANVSQTPSFVRLFVLSFARRWSTHWDHFSKIITYCAPLWLPLAPALSLLIRFLLAYAYHTYMHTSSVMLLWCNQIFKYVCRLLCDIEKKWNCIHSRKGKRERE